MNRRSAIRHAIIISSGAALLPSCLQKDKGASFPLKNISLSGSEQDMLADLAEAIIPGTNNFIGSKDIRAHEFMMMMVDECYKPEEQKSFVSGLKSFGKLSSDRFNNAFPRLSAEQKKELLGSIESKKDIPDDVLKFYEIAKRQTLQAFTSSKQYLTEVRHYKIVPGSNFKGCVPVKQTAAN
jgi:hypothetical protein